MTADPRTIAADKPLAHALVMMDDGGYRHNVPVVDNGKIIGMVSARDALGAELTGVRERAGTARTPDRNRCNKEAHHRYAERPLAELAPREAQLTAARSVQDAFRKPSP